MLNVKLIMKEYDRGGENEHVTERIVRMPTIPSDKQYLIVDIAGRTKILFVENSYLLTDERNDIAAYVFAVATSAPYQEAIKVGVHDDEASIPSLVHFEGRTIGDLLAFLSEYPAEYEVRFTDNEVLVAKSKSDVIILRLDNRADYN